MARPPPSPAYTQYVDDELVRAPVLFDHVAEGAIDQLRRGLAGQGAGERSAASDLIQAIGAHRAGLSQIFTRTLREQAEQDRERLLSGATDAPGAKPPSLSLVEEEQVAVDVELSHLIDVIKTTAEHELLELRPFIAALVGDLDVSADHNPFRPESYAQALWMTSQSLPLARGNQMRFMRVAALPLAALLRQSYAAACTRLEGMGIEPASYRTVIMSGGSRRSAGVETTYTPDLHRMRDSMPAPAESTTPLRYEGQLGSGAVRRQSWVDVARQATSAADRQAVELVGRLFEAMASDERVPPDVLLLLSRLHGPAMRLTLHDSGVLDQQHHPLWRFVHLLAYEAEMAPHAADPERRRLLRLGQQLIDQIAAEPEQRRSVYRLAVQRVDEFLRQRLERRCASAATQIGAMQKLEQQLLDGEHGPDTLSGMVDLRVMDSVPAADLDEDGDGDTFPPAADEAATQWLEHLRLGTWVRLYLQGRWVQAQLLWRGERGEVWLFGDGASDATWAVRRNALMRLFVAARGKTLVMRSLLGRAARRVQEEVEASKPD